VTVRLIEDAHRADDATLDVLGFVARRIAPLPALAEAQAARVSRSDVTWRRPARCGSRSGP
jgi:hypothetical protein